MSCTPGEACPKIVRGLPLEPDVLGGEGLA